MQLLKKHPAISEETFLELIDAKKDSFYRVAYSYTRHREDALDVVSESVSICTISKTRIPFIPGFTASCPTPR